MDAKRAICQAIFHYQAEAKKYVKYPNNDYTKPILKGLEEALKKVEKYEELVDKILIK